MLTLGPELFRMLNAKQQVVGDQIPVRYGMPGLSLAEITFIEAQLGFRLPADFAYLFQHLQDPGRVLFPWSSFEKQEYDEVIRRVRERIEFSIDHHESWPERWGRRSAVLFVALENVRMDFESWPKLLPIYRHRFLAAEPCRSGNPVFSIMGTDIIYYGADLAHYLVNEFIDHNYALHTREQKIQRIPIWSDLAEWN